MGYEALAVLVESHKSQIARQVAEAVIAQKLRLYSDLTVEQLTKLTITRVETICEYLRNGNIQEYRALVKKVTEERRKQGYSMEEVSAGGLTLANRIKALIEQKLSGPENERTRADYLRRIDSLTALGRVSAFSTILEKE